MDARLREKGANVNEEYKEPRSKKRLKEKLRAVRAQYLEQAGNEKKSAVKVPKKFIPRGMKIG